ncbi:VWA domain-containing protein [Rhodobacteraceae bacterium B1Z28]|uniref:VWA domain-containing protein n=1 Tax=Ruegeria haliotis TaxID=2747601 RepID=A0ABX2PKX7_9RHOB|nr:Tad domain-containing protein [Ruegeria haliotis]NVO54775.1 VWA domain-containing protein [Ruegeria haliotis]
MNNFVWKSKFSKLKRMGATGRSSESFAASESGNATIMGICFTMLIIHVCGFGLDMMRYDRERARLQYALDRAVLAAADLDQELCPEVVVRDYLSKEGLDEFLDGEPVVVPDICGSTAVTIDGYRRVEATAKMDVKTHFMWQWGQDTLPTVAHSVAEESIDDVEISLVLDVSGSMNRYGRLTNLKNAASRFVQEMADKTEDGKLSISIVPYATQVAVPDILMTELSTSGENEFANCINFADNEFGSTNFDLNLVRPRTLHISPWPWNTDYYNYDERPNGDFVRDEICDRRQNREVAVLQKDPDTLKTYINNLEASGNTSIDIGLKWGLALLDESFQPVAARLAQNGDVPAEFASRPNKYASNDSMKVVVLMTDGSNTSQFQINEPYRENESIIWWNGSTVNYSTFDARTEKYYWHGVDNYERNNSEGWYWARETWQDCPYGGFLGDDPYTAVVETECRNSYTQARCTNWRQNARGEYECTSFDNRYTREVSVTDNDGNELRSTQIEWPDVWKRTTRLAIRDLLQESLGSTIASNWFDNSASEINASKKNPRVHAMCADAEAKNIVVFTIAFEAPSAGKAILQACSSDDGAYYEATGDEIVDVFASIGSSIRNLRLTQ